MSRTHWHVRVTPANSRLAVIVASLGLLVAAPPAAIAGTATRSDPPPIVEWTPLKDRAGRIGDMARAQTPAATLSGTMLKQGAAVSTWLMYPGACQDRAAGTWAPRTTPQADSLDSYATGTMGGYTRLDRTIQEILWHTTDVAHAGHATQEPTVLTGTSSLWCGEYDPNFLAGGGVGYPNQTQQLLYIDTGSHGASPYALTLTMNQSTEWGYDFVYLIGGGNNDIDPIVNSRAKLDNLLDTGADGYSRLLVSWTGSILNSTPGATSITPPAAIVGAASGQPDASVSVSVTIPFAVSDASGPVGAHRALYVLFVSDDLYSSQDGNWPFGHGAIWDDLTTSDNGPIYTDTGTPSGTDPVIPPYVGMVIQGSYGTQGYIAARVTPGVGELWQIVDGLYASTNDACQVQKNDSADKMFFGADVTTRLTLPGQSNSIVSCTFPVPPGTGSVIATWNAYLDLPRGSGVVQNCEYRFFKNGAWSNWLNTTGGFAFRSGIAQRWVQDGDELAQAAQADSVQLRYNIACIDFFGIGPCRSLQVEYGVLYDDLSLQIVTGPATPSFAIFPGDLAQSTFVDGTMTGLNCTTPPCWPGIRGSETPETPNNPGIDIHDNVNSPLRDEITAILLSGLRLNGMGINWKQGYDWIQNQTLNRTNASYNAAFDQPRMIYRLFDPATNAWSPFDSTVLDAHAVRVSAADTTVTESRYRVNWPPRDKAGQSLPGGFAINGKTAYNDLAFLPRGTRLQYYFKAVDINGGAAYQFTSDLLANEVVDLPTLPGGSAVAPDILEFDVLPGRYTPGSSGSLLAGRTDTPILDLDGSYSNWSFQQNPVVQALRGMGVRADRYRRLPASPFGANVGGHELTSEGQPRRRSSNYFPNMTEYSIRESLSTWYRILIQSSHVQSGLVDDEQDAQLIEAWWSSPTPGSSGGDRCFFASGDDYANALVNTSAFDPSPRRHEFASQTLGIQSVAESWNGTAMSPYPVLDDRFSAPNSLSPGGSPLPSLGYGYGLDGGCPDPNRFDALTKTTSSEAQNAVLFPTFSGATNVAGIANMAETDAVTDQDRGKALAYGFSIQFVRKAGMATGAPNYLNSGTQERMQVLYKFLASCRGARSGSPGDTTKCWPCPTDANMTGNWAALAGFQTDQCGPLYPIQDNAAATGVEVSDASGVPRVNRLDGNFPNPFNPQTTIRFSSAKPGPVTIRIFNVGGQLVRAISMKAESGANEVRWNGRRDDGTSLASGIYFYRVRFTDGSESGSRMALVK